LAVFAATIASNSKLLLFVANKTKSHNALSLSLASLSTSLWPRFQPLSGLAFNLSLASLSTSSPTLAFQATSAFFYRMPCSALAKKSLRIHDPALTPGLGSEKGYTFIFQATKGKET
jgi:hypothetical protein